MEKKIYWIANDRPKTEAWFDIETIQIESSVNINELVGKRKERGGDRPVRSVFFYVRAADYLWNYAKSGKCLGVLSVKRYPCKYGETAKKNEKKNIG